MGFWSKLGKIGLKVAPYAAMAIPGVGPLAAAGIQAGIKAAQTKASGGSWGDALKGGALAAGTSYAGAKIPGLDKIGLGPTKGASTKLTGGGFAKGLGNFAKQTGKNFLQGEYGIGPSQQSGLGGSMKIPLYAGGSINIGGNQGGFGGFEMPTGINGPLGREGQNMGGWQQLLGDVGGLFNRGGNQRQPDYGGGMADYGGRYAQPREDPGLSRFHMQMRRQLGPVMGNPNQNNPNLADSIAAGRMESIRNQPFRGGYNVRGYGPEPEGGGDAPEIDIPMPPIYPTGGRRRQQAAY